MILLPMAFHIAGTTGYTTMASLLVEWVFLAFCQDVAQRSICLISASRVVGITDIYNHAQPKKDKMERGGKQQKQRQTGFMKKHICICEN
jgi:hypothetical protein